MDARHIRAELERIETDPDYSGGWDRARVRAFRKVMNLIRNKVQNESQFKNHRGLNYEPMKRHAGQYSMRLNDQWRLVVEIEKRDGPNNNVCVIVDVTDYH